MQFKFSTYCADLHSPVRSLATECTAPIQAKASRDGDEDVPGDIPDGFYLIGNISSPYVHRSSSAAQ
jgi:hypothetical protein